MLCAKNVLKLKNGNNMNICQSRIEILNKWSKTISGMYDSINVDTFEDFLIHYPEDKVIMVVYQAMQEYENIGVRKALNNVVVEEEKNEHYLSDMLKVNDQLVKITNPKKRSIYQGILSRLEKNFT